jgi:hypothetical protein
VPLLAGLGLSRLRGDLVGMPEGLVGGFDVALDDGIGAHHQSNQPALAVHVRQPDKTAGRELAVRLWAPAASTVLREYASFSHSFQRADPRHARRCPKTRLIAAKPGV